VTARVDLEGRVVTCSVHDLLPDPLRRSLGLPGEGFSRLAIGAELHRRVQAQRASETPGYLAEVPIDAALEIDGWTLRIAGRADGVVPGADGRPVVEEIKTVDLRAELSRSSATERLERHRWQVRLYAFCLYPDGGANARLLLVDLSGRRTHLEEVPWSPADARAFLRGRLHTWIALERERERLRERWRQAAAQLPFPYPEPRPVQLEAMQAVDEALAAGRHLLLAAPTGTGKTAAALYPTVRHALQHGRRVVFLTAKTLQQKLAVETVQLLQEGAWRSLQLRAKAKMCANREVICHEELCEFAREYGLKVQRQGVLEALLESPPHLDPDRIFAVARTAQVCPFEVSLELVGHCSVIVCDYNYVFAPNVSLASLVVGGELDDTYLIIDEAHNLVERAREYYSPRLSTAALAQARRVVEGYSARVCQQLLEVLTRLEGLVRDTVNEALGRRTGVLPTELPTAALAQLRLELDGLMPDYFAFKRDAELWLAEDPLIATLLTLAQTSELAALEAEELAPLAQRSDDGDEAVRLFCLDAARFTGAVIARSAGCVAMSATLEPFEFYRDLLGFPPQRTDTLALPSPFPPEHRLVIAVDSVDTSYRHRHRFYEPIARLVAELTPAGRNVLALFPSYAFLREVASRLRAPGHRVEVQQEGDSDAARRRVLELLRGNEEPVLLMAVMGGVFAEGVDYPGDMLQGVIVVSPALPLVTPERELLKQHFAERYERGFEYAYLVPGMTRVVQAAGRLIRSDQDRGVIVLMCKRFLRRPYVDLLPHDWTGGDPAELRTEDPVLAVREFFRNLSC
jgi:DNA excision repair protein ERCC-2